MATAEPPPKTDTILKCILPHIKDHRDSSGSGEGPFVLAIAGVQGSGKSTLAASIVQELEQTNGLRAAHVSLDDFYRTHDELLALKTADPDNKLFRTRGHAGSHDESLAAKFFSDVKGQSGSVAIPSFDKSAFNGEGDRAPSQEWMQLKLPIDVLVFEGWCLGFSAISDDELQRQWDLAKALRREMYSISGTSVPKSTLPSHQLGHLKIMNENLRKYGQEFMGPGHFDYLVQFDTTDMSVVYQWRIEQEHDLRKRKGSGMSDDQVLRFVEGYMPAYELYLGRLRCEPFFGGDSGKERRHLQLILNVDRSILRSKEL
jgi:D-glycerate 3-kinase